MTLHSTYVTSPELVIDVVWPMPDDLAHAWVGLRNGGDYRPPVDTDRLGIEDVDTDDGPVAHVTYDGRPVCPAADSDLTEDCLSCGGEGVAGYAEDERGRYWPLGQCRVCLGYGVLVAATVSHSDLDAALRETA